MWLRTALVFGVYGAGVAETAIVEQPATLQVCWLVLVASFAMWRLPATEAAGWGAGIGLMCDAVSATPFGLHVLLLSLPLWGATFCRDRWLGQSLASYGVLTMLVTAAVVLGVSAGRRLLGEEVGTPPHVAMVAAGAAAATGLCGLLGVIAGRTLMYAAAANGLAPRGRAASRTA